MKKLITLLSFILIFAMLVPSYAMAEENKDTLADWNITVSVPDGKTAVLKTGEGIYYIYAQKSGSIPYVMLKVYDLNFESYEDFFDKFTNYMGHAYDDLEVADEPIEKEIGGKPCCELDYTYTVSGHQVTDRRIVVFANDMTYMFASKEVEELKMTVGTMLEDMIADCVIMDDSGEAYVWDAEAEKVTEEVAEEPVKEDAQEEAKEESDAEEEQDVPKVYLYKDKNGAPRYWLDNTGILAQDVVLHSFYKTDEGKYQETYFILDGSTAEYTDTEDRVVYHKIYNSKMKDCSSMFKTFELLRDEKDNAVIHIVMNEDAGDDIDGRIIQAGDFTLAPARPLYWFVSEWKNGIRYDIRASEDGNKFYIHQYGEKGIERTFTIDRKTFVMVDQTSCAIGEVLDEEGNNILRRGDKAYASFESDVIRFAIKGSIFGQREFPKGEYVFNPSVYCSPWSFGPYSEEELATLAKWRYMRQTGLLLNDVSVEKSDDGMFTIKLFDGSDVKEAVMEVSVNENGIGTIVPSGESISLRG